MAKTRSRRKRLPVGGGCWDQIEIGQRSVPFCGRGFGPPELGEAVKAKPLKGGGQKPPTLLRRVAEGPADARDARPCGVAGTDAETVALGQVFGRRGAAPANSMMLLPPAAVTS